MKKSFLPLACLLVCLGLGFVFAQDYSTTPATASFRDDFLSPLPDRIGSDGLGIYVDNVNRVECRVDALGIFYLSTSQPSGKPGVARQLFIDFSNPVTEEEDPENYGQDAPFLAGSFSGYVQNYDQSVNLWAMPIGSSVPTNFRVIISGGWTVRFNPEERPGTTRILATRISPDSWKFETVKDESLTTGDIGKLYQIIKIKKQNVWYDHGNFHLPFALTVTLKK